MSAISKKFAVALLTSASLITSAWSKPGSLTLIVATNGSDEWSGKLTEPNRRKTDGPLATPTHALEVRRNILATNGAAQCDIRLRNGTYFFTNTLTLTPQDSGLNLGSYKNERPVLSSGRRITGWQKVPGSTNGLCFAAVPAALAGGQWLFHELWVNGQRATRARHPNQGYFQVEALPDSTPNWEQGNARFIFKSGDLKAWPSVTNADIVVMTKWVESRLPVVSIDESSRIVSFGKKSVFQLANDDRYYLENAFEALDEPGEWFLDATTKKVFYLPRPGEREIDAVAPLLADILKIDGETNRPVEHLVFSGLTFSHAEWYFPEPVKKSGNSDLAVGGFPQAAVGVPGAVWGQVMRNCLFTNCAFTHLGGYGLELARGCSSNIITHCAFSDLGAGGIKLGEGALRSSRDEQTHGNAVRDCTISDGGHMFLSGEGIWLGETADNDLSHNLIHDFYYTGISIGWTWGYGPSFASNNLVAFNHVHHIGVKSDGDGPVLSDMGGIYTLGMQPGTKIINNLWHDIAGLRYGGWGIYFDEGSSSILAQSNIVYRTTHGGFHQHYGATNILRNNIFAFARDHQLQRTRPELHRSFSFETNIVYFASGVLLGGDWSNDHYAMDWNIYWDARTNANPQSFKFGNTDLEGWRKRGHDTHSLIADPVFAAAKKDDFRIPGTSQALQIGFQRINLSVIGPRK